MADICERIPVLSLVRWRGDEGRSAGGFVGSAIAPRLTARHRLDVEPVPRS